MPPSPLEYARLFEDKVFSALAGTLGVLNLIAILIPFYRENPVPWVGGSILIAAAVGSYRAWTKERWAVIAQDLTGKPPVPIKTLMEDYKGEFIGWRFLTREEGTDAYQMTISNPFDVPIKELSVRFSFGLPAHVERTDQSSPALTKEASPEFWAIVLHDVPVGFKALYRVQLDVRDPSEQVHHYVKTAHVLTRFGLPVLYQPETLEITS